MSLTIDPARATLITGQTAKFSTHSEGAPTGMVVRWVIADRKKGGSSISQDGVFRAGMLGIYHVMAVATTGDGTVLKASVVKVTVLGKSEF